MAVARYACAAERSAARREMGVGGVDAMSRDVAALGVVCGAPESRDVATSVVLAPALGRVAMKGFCHMAAM